MRWIAINAGAEGSVVVQWRPFSNGRPSREQSLRLGQGTWPLRFAIGNLGVRWDVNQIGWLTSYSQTHGTFW